MMLRKLMIIIIAVVLLGGAVYLWQQQSAASKAYSVENLIRLHVVANSDSLADQQVKYLIRDRLVARLTPVLSRAKDIGQARRLIEARRQEISDLADQTLKEQGRGYGSKVELGRYSFPAKGYGNLVFPAGNYEAVRVVLGRGGGANWWCVLFPPLCFVDISRSTTAESSLNGQVEDVLAAGRRDEANRTLGGDVVVLRFKFVDWLRHKQSQLAGQGSS